jgi:CHAT domain-containing protein
VPTAPPAGAAQRLVVANPETPPELGLPPLGPYPAEPAAGVTVLRGADATPSRVLVAMQAASVIEFHTHGLIADDLFEASHLVLSPDVDRRYALTAGDVAHVHLAAQPLVILGSCRAAASSHVLEGGIGLAEGFLRAGARAVIASPDAVQDLGAQAFFAQVRDRVVKGTDPATALRDERMRHLATASDDTWVSGVVVFQ